MSGIAVAFLTQALLWSGMVGGGKLANQNGPAYSEDRVGTETIEKTLKVNSGSLILLDTQLGNVSISEYDGNEVSVELRLEGTPENIRRFHFTHDYFGNQVTLKGWLDGSGDPQLSTVQFSILIPKDSSYAIRALTRSGNIHAVVSKNARAFDLTTELGSVWVKIPENVSANIDASTLEVGKVSFKPAKCATAPFITYDIKKADHLKGRMGNGGIPINAYAGIGNVSLEAVSSQENS